METEFIALSDLIRIATFGTPKGAKEYYITINSNEERTFQDELNSLYNNYIKTIEHCRLSEDTLVFSRFYLSDIANEKDLLKHSKIYDALKKSAVSVIQQCPVNGGSLSLLVYHIKMNSNGALRKEIFTYDSINRRNGALIHGNFYDLLWIANFYGIGAFDSFKQTTEILRSFNSILEDNGMTLLDNTVRTWVYVRDVDNHYKGMVDSRREFFEAHGLNPQSRYIASTGIEGFSREVNSLVAFDAFAVKNLKREQIIRMEALNHLSPTIKYGVTFERGTRILFGDRSHLHISGTASINKNGHVMYVGDARKQTERTIENVRALLAPHGADLRDMAYLIVYVRNLKDRNKVMEVLERKIPSNIPYLFLEGAVCRPSWLVELEGVGIIPDSSEFPPFF